MVRVNGPRRRREEPSTPRTGSGTDGDNVVPNLEPATRIITLDRGEDLPDTLADGELERLKADNAVGTAEEVAAMGVPPLEGEGPSSRHRSRSRAAASSRRRRSTSTTSRT
jgi:hypothetical protein